jgi:peroxiredoxin
MHKSNFKLIILAMLICFASARPLFASGAKANDFVLNNIEGKSVKLSDYKGKNLVLFFWTTWCPYCVREMKKLAREYPEIKSNGYELLAVNVGEKPNSVKKFINKNAINFPIVFDKDMNVSFAYNVIGLPTFFIIGKNQEVLTMGNMFPNDYKEYK